MLVATLFWSAVLVLAARMLSKARSPWHAAATLSVAAFGAWFISLPIIWLTAAEAQTGAKMLAISVRDSD